MNIPKEATTIHHNIILLWQNSCRQCSRSTWPFWFEKKFRKKIGRKKGFCVIVLEGKTSTCATQFTMSLWELIGKNDLVFILWWWLQSPCEIYNIFATLAYYKSHRIETRLCHQTFSLPYNGATKSVVGSLPQSCGQRYSPPTSHQSPQYSVWTHTQVAWMFHSRKQENMRFYPPIVCQQRKHWRAQPVKSRAPIRYGHSYPLLVKLPKCILHDIDTYICSRCSRLRSLNLRNCHQLSPTTVLAIAQNCPQLIQLTLSGCIQVDDCTLQSIATYIPALKELHISGCYLVTDEGMLMNINRY